MPGPNLLLVQQMYTHTHDTYHILYVTKHTLL